MMMACFSSRSCSASLISVITMLMIFSLLFLHGGCTEFEVGDDKGWKVPPSNDPQLYDEWAQKNRFILNDTLRFSYKKDSVMVVTEDEYANCSSSQPLFFANDGKTTFLLDKPRLFYFMSGVSGHCERGERMIVKVLNMESNNQNSQDGNPNVDHNTKKNNGGGASHRDLVFMGFASFPSLVLLMIAGFVMMN